VEIWAYKAGSVRGLTPGGLIFLEPNVSGAASGSVVCFNSRGEGGYFRTPGNLPHDLISVSDDTPTEQFGTCSEGVITLAGSKTAIPVGGNCSAWGIVKDSRGMLYAGTDRGILFCFDAGGKVLWKYNAGVELSAAPLFSRGDPVFSTGDHLICVRDGALRWNLPLEYCRVRLVDQSGTVFFTINETTGAADHDGQVLWTLSVRGEPLIVDPEGRLYVKDYFGKFAMCLA
jgi:outer membrane protein assembly factor BamB